MSESHYWTLVRLSILSTIIHYLKKLKQYDLPPHIRRWIATFPLGRTQQVKIGNNFSPPGHPKGGVPQGTLLGPKCFLVYINDNIIETHVPLYTFYVDDSTLFEICHRKSESVLQHFVDNLTSQRGGHYITAFFLAIFARRKISPDVR